MTVLDRYHLCGYYQAYEPQIRLGSYDIIFMKLIFFNPKLHTFVYTTKPNLIYGATVPNQVIFC